MNKGNHCFQHRKRRSQRRKHHQQHKDGEQNLPQRHFHEHGRQNNEDQTRPLARFEAESKYRRENNQPRQQRNQKVHPHNDIT